MPLSIGQSIHNNTYKIIAQLGRGGFGETYLANEKAKVGRLVAIKESHAGDQVSQASRALMTEFLLSGKLKHHRLPQVYELFHHADRMCIVMEYIPGNDLSAYINQCTLVSQEQAIEWMVQMLEVLAYLHSNQVIHRDVKPSNIRIHADTGSAYLLDLGISKSGNESGLRGGTPPYAPLEQYHLHSSMYTFPATDVYAAGVTLYQLLTGLRAPDAPDLHDPSTMLFFPPHRAVSPALQHIIFTALQRNPRYRYPDAQAMFHALRSLVHTPMFLTSSSHSSTEGHSFSPTPSDLYAKGTFTPLPNSPPRIAITSGHSPLMREGRGAYPYLPVRATSLPKIAVVSLPSKWQFLAAKIGGIMGLVFIFTTLVIHLVGDGSGDIMKVWKMNEVFGMPFLNTSLAVVGIAALCTLVASLGGRIQRVASRFQALLAGLVLWGSIFWLWDIPKSSAILYMSKFSTYIIGLLCVGISGVLLDADRLESSTPQDRNGLSLMDMM